MFQEEINAYKNLNENLREKKHITSSVYDCTVEDVENA